MSEHAAHQQGTHDAGTSAEVIGTGATAAEWDERYRSKAQVWSGKPNPQLVREAGSLRPGKALDLGAGEGADAIWLAHQGWHVTAVDVSAVALERAQAHAAAAHKKATDEGIAGRIAWQQADLAHWQPEGQYELVTSQFLHSQDLAWQVPLRAAAAAVKPGGTLLVVGHHPDKLPPWGGAHTHDGMFYTCEDLARELSLDAAEWQIEVLTTRDRPITGPEGQEFTIADVVLRATRLL
ncbi:SAM-dependent methyltransferase [Arthrobacter sp. Leaf141]|uniref:SAM-dependent methyltransferase n=1 Tax=Arthrobacter sp. Leaf141 TaxID=1736273 RepID=UPI0006FBCEF9|nr:class I SAM-dependent methyltransferase [Arthrobacter sp. Leaf141]KQR04171.1 SAM-dependent methyltransferase [Arthrobacter sp. Leaf141]